MILADEVIVGNNSIRKTDAGIQARSYATALRNVCVITNCARSSGANESRSYRRRKRAHRRTCCPSEVDLSEKQSDSTHAGCSIFRRDFVRWASRGENWVGHSRLILPVPARFFSNLFNWWNRRMGTVFAQVIRFWFHLVMGEPDSSVCL